MQLGKSSACVEALLKSHSDSTRVESPLPLLLFYAGQPEQGYCGSVATGEQEPEYFHSTSVWETNREIMLGNLQKSKPFSLALTDKSPRKLPRYNSSQAMEAMTSFGFRELLLPHHLWSLLSEAPLHEPWLSLYIFPALQAF